MQGELPRALYHEIKRAFQKKTENGPEVDIRSASPTDPGDREGICQVENRNDIEDCP